MNRIPVSALFVFLTFLLFACDGPKQTRLPRHSGKPGEVLLVMDDSKWLGVEGDSLRAVLEARYPNLPQVEPSFSLLQFNQSQMGKLLRNHRNIIQIRLGAEAESRNKVTLSRNNWASNQLVFTAYAETDSDWFNLLQNEFPKVVEVINQTEIERLQQGYKGTGNEALDKSIAQNFGVQVYLPSDCEIAEKHKDFWWIKRERVRYLGNSPHDITQGFIVYHYPYTSDSAFTQNEILAMRDSMTQKYIPGPLEGTYMVTEYRYPPVSEQISVDGRFAILTRGLWRTENYFMGGPFVSLTTTNPSGDQIISLSGFVFAPKFDKREYIREVEAILLSAHFPNSTSTSTDANP